MLDTICETLLGLYLDLPPLSDERQDDTPTQSRQREEIESLNADILEPILRSPAFDHLTLRHSTRTTRPHLRPLSGQMGNPLRRITREAVSPVLSRLHALLPPTLDENDAVHATYRGYLRELVYSAINFKEENDWAPLKTDGRVDWVLVDAISSIMSEFLSVRFGISTKLQWPMPRTFLRRERHPGDPPFSHCRMALTLFEGGDTLILSHLIWNRAKYGIGQV